MEMDGTFVDIEGADSDTYTPADADIEYYLRATAMYTDDEGSGKSAMAMPDYSVQGEPARNSAPDFTGQDEDDLTDGDSGNEVGGGEHRCGPERRGPG